METMSKNITMRLIFILSMTYSLGALAQNNPITFNPGGNANGDIHGIKGVAASGNNTTKLHIYRNFSFDANDIDQLVIDNLGNVGIGTAFPDAKFHVYGSDAGNGAALASIMLGRSNGPEIQAIQSNADTDIQSMAFRVKSSGSSTASNFEAMRIRSNGNVGIGTSDPLEKLDVNGSIRITNASIPMGLMTEVGGTTPLLNLSVNFRGASVNNSYKGASFRMDTRNNYPLFNWFARDANSSTDVRLMALTQEGKLGIGTASPDAKLAVNGDIHAREVRVDLINWPDYVFDDEYERPTLIELESYIKANRHLPGIPSASEVEENGISLGEMDKNLLEKIEELTLYIIEMKKENDSLKQRIEKLEK